RAQLAKQLARGAGRLVRMALFARAADELAQMVAIRGGKRVDELAERFVAFLEQALAPGFDAMRRSGSAAALVAAMGERGEDRGQLVVAAAHLLGEELQLAF